VRTICAETASGRHPAAAGPGGRSSCARRPPERTCRPAIVTVIADPAVHANRGDLLAIVRDPVVHLAGQTVARDGSVTLTGAWTRDRSA
jgi:hypothetical protein